MRERESGKRENERDLYKHVMQPESVVFPGHKSHLRDTVWVSEFFMHAGQSKMKREKK